MVYYYTLTLSILIIEDTGNGPLIRAVRLPPCAANMAGEMVPGFVVFFKEGCGIFWDSGRKGAQENKY
jgi:hypothetical protein